jgi:hypothetical protein
MARSFAGGAATDMIAFGTSVFSNVRPMSVAAWVYINAYDATTRRVYDKYDGNADGSWHSLVYLSNFGAGDIFEFESGLWSTFGAWECPGPAAAGWHHIAATYAYSATTDDPVMYVDGASQTVTESVTPTGTIGSESATLAIGNRNNDTARCFDGRIAEFALWNRVLSASEVAVLADGFSPQFVPNGLSFYTPLIGRQSPEVNKYGASGTVTGATAIAHPRIIYPAPRQVREYTPAAVASTPHRLLLMGCGI